MAPVVHAIRRRGLPVQLVATGQHHDAKMMGTFLEGFDLRVDHLLTLAHRDLMGSFVDILSSLARLIGETKPALAIAVGDTTTVLATALAARKSGVGFGHIEAGLRAFSRELPEEEHRICADAIGDLLFAPTRIAVENLTREHVNGKVILTGNPILDALRAHVPAPTPPERRTGILVTIHRQETVDDPARLARVVAALGRLAERRSVLWPLHPRTAQKLAEHGQVLSSAISTCDPIGHVEFLKLLANARVVVTDSGGVQEEAAILGTPCVCVRDHTERPETIAAGVGLLAGTETESIIGAVDRILGDWSQFARPVPHLYGDGRAGDKIAEACAAFLDRDVALPRAAHGR